MILVADIGNTTITVGVYDDDKLIQKWLMSSDVKRSEDEYGVILCSFLKHSGLEGRITDSVISSVVLPLTEKIENAVSKYIGIKSLIVNYKINTGVKIKTDKPEEVGADRIVNAYAASLKYKLPVIVVDFGTATSFDIVNEKNEFIGGIISAGMKIQAHALSQFTSKLPKVKIEAPEKTIATNTVDAMLSGIVRGHAAMIDGLIAACEEELGTSVTTVATGGYSSIISKYLKRPFDDVNENLTLDGLNELWKLNQVFPVEKIKI